KILTQTNWNGTVTSYTYNTQKDIVEERISNPLNPSHTRVTQFAYLYQSGSKLSNVKKFGASLSDLINETIIVYYPLDHAAKNKLKSVTTCNRKSLGIINQCQTVNYSYSFHSNKLMSQMVVSGPSGGAISWNSQGYLTRFTNAAGHTTTYSNHTSLGLPTTITDPNGLVRTRTYDAKGRITREVITGSGSPRTNSYEYGPFGVTKRTIGGVTKHIDFLSNGAISTVAEGTATSRLISQYYGRTADGDINSVSHYSDNTLQYYREYVRDEVGRVLTEIGNSGQSKGYQWDNNSNLISERDSFNRYSYHTYDAHDQHISTTDPINTVIQNLYESSGKLTQVINGR